MPEGENFEARLTDLKRRWEADPSSRIFLQLAEEYRRLGQLQEARRVLEEGLQQHPNHLSARVALGRCWLELENPEAARAVLEQVVAQDATQLVAIKLLVETYLRLEQPEQALERLEHYRLLNDRDPEIPDLEERISQMAKGGGRPHPRSEDGDEVFRLPPTPGPSVDLEELAGETVAPPRSQGREDGREGGIRVAGDPFPDFLRPGDWQRYVDGLGGEGIFPLGLRHRESAAASPEPAPESLPATSPAEEEVLGTGGGTATPASIGAPAMEEPLETAGAEPGATFPRRDEPMEVEAQPAARVREAPAEEEQTTITLGQLYLRQGHHAEAARIFQAVLAREPENEVALRGLEEATRRRLSSPVTAAELLAGWEEPEGPPREILLHKKISLLRAYRRRIRRGAGSDVS